MPNQQPLKGTPIMELRFRITTAANGGIRVETITNPQDTPTVRREWKDMGSFPDIDSATQQCADELRVQFQREVEFGALNARLDGMEGADVLHRLADEVGEATVRSYLDELLGRARDRIDENQARRARAVGEAVARLLETWDSTTAEQKRRIPTALERELNDVAHFHRKAIDGAARIAEAFPTRPELP